MGLDAVPGWDAQFTSLLLFLSCVRGDSRLEELVLKPALVERVALAILDDH